MNIYNFFILCRANLSGTLIVKILHKKVNDSESQYNIWVIGQLVIYKEKINLDPYLPHIYTEYIIYMYACTYVCISDVLKT